MKYIPVEKIGEQKFNVTLKKEEVFWTCGAPQYFVKGKTRPNKKGTSTDIYTGYESYDDVDDDEDEDDDGDDDKDYYYYYCYNYYIII